MTRQFYFSFSPSPLLPSFPTSVSIGRKGRRRNHFFFCIEPLFCELGAAADVNHAPISNLGKKKKGCACEALACNLPPPPLPPSPPPFPSPPPSPLFAFPMPGIKISQAQENSLPPFPSLLRSFCGCGKEGQWKKK